MISLSLFCSLLLIKNLFKLGLNMPKKSLQFLSKYTPVQKLVAKKLFNFWNSFYVLRGVNPNTLDIFWPSLSETGMLAAAKHHLSNFDKSLEPTHFIHVSSLTSSSLPHILHHFQTSHSTRVLLPSSSKVSSSFSKLGKLLSFTPFCNVLLSPSLSQTFLDHDNEVCHGYSLVVYALSCSWLIIVGLWVYMLGWWYLMLGYCYVLVYGNIYRKIW